MNFTQKRFTPETGVSGAPEEQIRQNRTPAPSASSSSSSNRVCLCEFCFWCRFGARSISKTWARKLRHSGVNERPPGVFAKVRD